MYGWNQGTKKSFSVDWRAMLREVQTMFGKGLRSQRRDESRSEVRLFKGGARRRVIGTSKDLR